MHTEKTYEVKGMTCAACAASVERILNKMESVDHASVNLILNQVTIHGDPVESIDVYNERLSKAGFSLSEMEHLKDIELSPDYLFFYDKLERGNYCERHALCSLCRQY